jgi:hypothetical protein
LGDLGFYLKIRGSKTEAKVALLSKNQGGSMGFDFTDSGLGLEMMWLKYSMHSLLYCQIFNLNPKSDLI